MKSNLWLTVSLTSTLLACGAHSRLDHSGASTPDAGATDVVTRVEGAAWFNCSARIDPPYALSQDDIGLIPKDITIAELRSLCPGARDSVYYEHEAVFPALHVQLRGLELWAVQTRMDDERFEPLPFREECGADFWVVVGDSATLPGDVPTTSTWSELRQQYGPPIMEPTFENSRVAWPGHAFSIDLSVPEPESLGEAVIWRVILRSGENRRECRAGV